MTVEDALSNFRAYWSIYTVIRETAIPNYLLARLHVPSSLNIDSWCSMLQDYPDLLLIDHLEFRWPLDYAIESMPVSKSHFWA